MRERLITVARDFGIVLKNLAVVVATGIIAIATSETTLNLARSTGHKLRFAASTAVHGLLAKAGEWFPRARKVIVVGAMGGFRQVKIHYNQNGAKSVQSIRNTLAPVGIASAIGSVILAFITPIAGAAMLIATYVVFYKDAEALPLTVFSTDAGVESSLGVGTALVVNLFRLAGAIRAGWRWVLSQFK
jgi:glycerol uptake facilitator-like aquaporin